MGERGGIYPARVYTAEDGPNRYSVTVVHYVDAPATVVTRVDRPRGMERSPEGRYDHLRRIRSSRSY